MTLTKTIYMTKQQQQQQQGLIPPTSIPVLIRELQSDNSFTHK